MSKNKKRNIDKEWIIFCEEYIHFEKINKFINGSILCAFGLVAIARDKIKEWWGR